MVVAQTRSVYGLPMGSEGGRNVTFCFLVVFFCQDAAKLIQKTIITKSTGRSYAAKCPNGHIRTVVNDIIGCKDKTF